MTKHRAWFLAFVILLIGVPALAQDIHVPGTATGAPQAGPAMMNDVRSVMTTMMADPVISKRMNELMASNPTFKTHVQQMRAMMSSGNGMMNGSGGTMNSGSGMHSPMMSASAGPKP